MVKTIAKLTLLTVLASLFALSRAQASQQAGKCVLRAGQCINEGCLLTCVFTGNECRCF